MMTILRCYHALTTLCLTVSLLSVTAVRAEEPVASSAPAVPHLVWCLDHFPRFHHYDDVAEPYGPSVDVMQELAKRAGFKLVFAPRTATARCIRLIADGQADLMSNLKYSAERDAVMQLLPYNQTVPESLFFRAADNRQMSQEQQLSQLTLVRIRGYMYSAGVMSFFQRHPRQTVEVDSIEAGLEMVLRSRVDALISPTISTSVAIDSVSSYQQKFRRAELNINRSENVYIHIGLSRRSPHAAMEPLLRQHLNEMIADGTVERLYAAPTRPPQLAPTVNL